MKILLFLLAIIYYVNCNSFIVTQLFKDNGCKSDPDTNYLEFTVNGTCIALSQKKSVKKLCNGNNQPIGLYYSNSSMCEGSYELKSEAECFHSPYSLHSQNSFCAQEAPKKENSVEIYQTEFCGRPVVTQTFNPGKCVPGNCMYRLVKDYGVERLNFDNQECDFRGRYKAQFTATRGHCNYYFDWGFVSFV